jgi:hypothetical protein
VFAAFNLGFLALDIYVAHSFNHFAQREEWVPLLFSVVAPLVLLPGVVTGRLTVGVGRWAGLIVGAASVAIGVLGLVLHLGSAFLARQTLENLVYTAPVAAPLAYTGVGLLLILNRLEPHDSQLWGRWVIGLALAGFAGNFLLSLADHAQNGFFMATEWIPVGAAAFAIGFLLPAVAGPVARAYVRVCYAVMAVQVAVGGAGAVLHLRATLAGPHDRAFDNLVYGAPVFAPLLFANLALLGAIGLWHLSAPSASAPGLRGPSARDALPARSRFR